MNKLKKLLKFNLSHMACLFISIIMLIGVGIYVGLPWLIDFYIDNTAV